MTVRGLIKLLRKMPQDLQVGYSAHDNSAHEIADWVHDVTLFDKDDPEFECSYTECEEDRRWYDDQPERAVVLRG